jgi:hypothetical protein
MDQVVCEAQAWETALSQAQQAYARRDLEGFAAQSERARNILPCLREGLSPAQAARWHEVDALSAVLVSDRAGAVGALRAAQAAMPGQRLDPAVVSPFVLGLEAEAERLGASPRQPVQGPQGLVLWVDGRVGASRPVEAPALLQVEDPQQGVIWTQALPMGAPLPDFPSPSPLVAAAAAPPEARSSRWGGGRPPGARHRRWPDGARDGGAVPRGLGRRAGLSLR